MDIYFYFKTNAVCFVDICCIDISGRLGLSRILVAIQTVFPYVCPSTEKSTLEAM